MKRWLTFVLVVVGLILVIAAVKGFGVYRMMQGFAAQGAPKFTVSTMRVGYQDWQPQLSAVGSLRAERGAQLSAEVAGIVAAIEFRSGQDVSAGTTLLRLRDADDRAHLESLRAAAALAQTTWQRDKAQFEAQAISQAVLDTDAANLRSARAQVAEQEALVAKKRVIAPFAGRIGIRAVDLGQYLAAGTAIATLQQLDPIFVDFSLPQQALTAVHPGQKVSLTTDAFPGQVFNGEVAALDPAVDTSTRNINLRAVLKNPDRRLLPGMYANVSVTTGAAVRQLTLPQTAIAYNPYGATVYLAVPPDTQGTGEGGAARPAAAGGAGAAASAPALVAKQVFVTTGDTRGDQVAILSGVKEGDEVVTSGQIKLRNGVAIVVNNSVQPSDDPNPKPQEH
ncbi:MAG: efflux RND transporter periplasmic adaptor subunit [Proteobacteria bacterium]|nr:efflux RND transporter periplasmic adaptor subunit [Pseudomonadota bacterium]